jgi:hypothetical protein
LQKEEDKELIIVGDAMLLEKALMMHKSARNPRNLIIMDVCGNDRADD